jgi:hypothetical protein
MKLSDLKIYDGEIPLRDNELFLSRDFLVKPLLNPYIIYSILKKEFGVSTNEDYDDDKSQWSYMFTYENFYVHIYDWKLYTTSIAVYHKEESSTTKSQNIANAIHGLLIKSAQQNKSILKNIVKYSQHKIVENPFVTYFKTAESILEVAKSLNEQATNTMSKNLEELFKDHSPLINEVFVEDKSSDLYRSAFLMYLSSFEGFLNLVYDFFLKPELKSERLKEKLAREQIDIKLRLLPLYCYGFKEKIINSEDERYKNYVRLVNLRNDFVHANLVKASEKYVVQEDEHLFIIENDDDSLIPTNINSLELKHVEIAKTTITEIIDLVLESMNKIQAKRLKKVLYEEVIEVKMMENNIKIS